MAKGRKKKKKRAGSRKDVRRELRTEYLAKVQALEKELSASDDPEHQFTLLADLSRDFFREFFLIRYEPTNEELIQELHKKQLKKSVKTAVEKFLTEMTTLRYASASSITKKVVQRDIEEFRLVIDKVYEDVVQVSVKKGKKKLPLVTLPADTARDFVAGVKILGKWAQLGFHVGAKFLAPKHFRNPEEEMENVMELLADSYELLEDGNVKKTEKHLQKIEKKLNTFTLEERKVVENEVTALKREIAFTKEKDAPQIKVPLSSNPEPVAAKPPEPETGGKLEDVPGMKMPERDEDELENFIRLAIEHNIEKNAIRERLLENGWPTKQVDKALDRFLK